MILLAIKQKSTISDVMFGPMFQVTLSMLRKFLEFSTKFYTLFLVLAHMQQWQPARALSLSVATMAKNQWPLLPTILEMQADGLKSETCISLEMVTELSSMLTRSLLSVVTLITCKLFCISGLSELNDKFFKSNWNLESRRWCIQHQACWTFSERILWLSWTFPCRYPILHE